MSLYEIEDDKLTPEDKKIKADIEARSKDRKPISNLMRVGRPPAMKHWGCVNNGSLKKLYYNEVNKHVASPYLICTGCRELIRISQETVKFE